MKRVILVVLSALSTGLKLPVINLDSSLAGPQPAVVEGRHHSGTKVQKKNPAYCWPPATDVQTIRAARKLQQ